MSGTQNSALLNLSLFFPFQICTEVVLSVRFTYSISCQGLDSDQSGIVKRQRSTPRLLTVQRSNGTTPTTTTTTPPGVVMGPADCPLRSQTFGPTGESHVVQQMMRPLVNDPQAWQRWQYLVVHTTHLPINTKCFSFYSIHSYTVHGDMNSFEQTLH